MAAVGQDDSLAEGEVRHVGDGGDRQHIIDGVVDGGMCRVLSCRAGGLGCRELDASRDGNTCTVHAFGCW